MASKVSEFTNSIVFFHSPMSEYAEPKNHESARGNKFQDLTLAAATIGVNEIVEMPHLLETGMWVASGVLVASAARYALQQRGIRLAMDEQGTTY